MMLFFAILSCGPCSLPTNWTTAVGFAIKACAAIVNFALPLAKSPFAKLALLVQLHAEHMSGLHFTNCKVLQCAALIKNGVKTVEVLLLTTVRAPL